MHFRGIIVLFLFKKKSDLDAASDWNRNHVLWQTDQQCFPDNRGRDPRNEFWNDPVYQVGLSVCSNIYLKVEDYRTENKMHVHIEYKWEKMVVAGISASPYYQVLQMMRIGLACLLSTALFIFGKWCCSDQFNLFVNGRFTESVKEWMFQLYSITVWWHSNTWIYCGLLIGYDTSEVVPFIQECLIRGACHFEPNSGWCLIFRTAMWYGNYGI